MITTLLFRLLLLIGFFKDLQPAQHFNYYAEYFQRCTIYFHKVIDRPPPYYAYAVFSVYCNGETIIGRYQLREGTSIEEYMDGQFQLWPHIDWVGPGYPMTVSSHTKAERFVTYAPLLINEGATP